jgi:hypothetical protein
MVVRTHLLQALFGLPCDTLPDCYSLDTLGCCHHTSSLIPTCHFLRFLLKFIVTRADKCHSERELPQFQL